MADDIYQQLAHFLNELPAGFPAAESGVELRILRKLFTPEEAAICRHLTLLAEPAHVVAYRLRQPAAEVAHHLVEMEAKGLISGQHRPGKPDEYAASQFAIGFWEEQVNHLDRELVELVEAYLPIFIQQGAWNIVPQLRTIPVGESIPMHSQVMAYERAEEILRSHTTFAVRNCICRQERRVLGQGCDKPLETCLTFGGAARQAVYTGRSRFISLDEALAILKLADEAGLVIQPSNSQNPVAMCLCCGCCCGVLRGLKLQDKPADLEASAFIAELDPGLCSACGVCEERCPMDAIRLSIGTAELDQDRCIGCGLCSSACPSGAVILVRKPSKQQPAIPINTMHTYLGLGQKRGTFGYMQALGALLRSGLDRLAARRG